MVEAPVISVVAPAYNEARNLAEFLASLVPVLASLGEPWEIVFVDDGRRDDTSGCPRRRRPEDELCGLRGAAAGQRRTRIVGPARNWGKDGARGAGLRHARGRAVTPIDGAGQHPPALIREFVARWRAGADMVVGVRTKRGEE